ncbi:hypothetical protein D9M71_695730 [compost metagenome]
MKAVLHLQEATITLAVLEGPRCHYQLIDAVMIPAAGRFQAFAAAGFGEGGSYSGHRRIRGNRARSP